MFASSQSQAALESLVALCFRRSLKECVLLLNLALNDDVQLLSLPLLVFIVALFL